MIVFHNLKYGSCKLLRDKEGVYFWYFVDTNYM